jgi:hypothetical protein
MPLAQSPAHYINSSKGCPSITEPFPLCFLLVHKMLLSPQARHRQWCNPIISNVIAQKLLDKKSTPQRIHHKTGLDME